MIVGTGSVILQHFFKASAHLEVEANTRSFVLGCDCLQIGMFHAVFTRLMRFGDTFAHAKAS